jgi:hypothetical protein
MLFHRLPFAPMALGACLCLSTVLPAHARGATEPPPPSAVDNPLTYDARSLALGGAGVALGANGALAVHNPALIDQVGQRAVTATFTPYFMRLKAPFRLANGERIEGRSGLLFGPFSQLGMIMRMTSRVSVGMVGFVTAAAGGSFAKVPLNSLSTEVPVGLIGDARVAQVAGELLVPVAVTVTSWLKLGAAYRITHAWQMANLHTKLGAPLSDASLHGTNFSGFAAGALAHVGPRLRLGLSYRSQVAMDMSGAVQSFAGSAQKRARNIPRGFVVPHRVKVGLAWRPQLPHPILIVAEGRLWLHQWANARERATGSGAVGVEYTFNHSWSARGGYSISMQPTTDANARPFAVPPGLGHGITGGAGLTFADWQFDGTLGYVISGKTITGLPTAGHYLAQGLIASIAATYAI